MAIQDGMRTHDEAGVKRYRMPDLLTLEEMKLYFAGTYGVDVELVPLSDDMKEKVTGVGVLPYAPPMSDRDREHSLLRKVLGIEDLEAKLDILVEGRVKELDSRVMTREQFEEKYGPQPTPAPPKEETEEAPASPDNTDQVEGPVPTFETTAESEQDVELPEQSPKTPAEELDRLLAKGENNE